MKKGDWDVGMALVLISLAPRLDVLILVSGDGDYVPLVEYLRNQGHRVEALAFGKSTSAKLVSEVDEFTDMDENHQQFVFQAKDKKSPNRSQ